MALPPAIAPQGGGGLQSLGSATGGSGAQTIIEYLATTEQRVGVNPHDLEDLLSDETATLGLQGVGGFFFAGAFWLGIEKLTDQPVFQLTVPLIGCGLSVVMGAALYGVGSFLTSIRRKKIRRILQNTVVIKNVPGQTP